MPARDHSSLDRYLLRGERVVLATPRHWAVVAEPVLTSIATLAVVVWFSLGVSAQFARVADVLWWVWFATFARALFCLYEWRREWFVATDRRLLLVYGFVVRKVDMMPLTKVTDLTYHRTVLGRLLRYGTFVLESAGQDQALSRVEFVPRPDATYRRMIAQIFHRDGDDPVEGDEYDDYDGYEEPLEDDPTTRPALSRRVSRLVLGRRDPRPQASPRPLAPHERLDARDLYDPTLRTAGSRDDGPVTEPIGGLPGDAGESLYRSGYVEERRSPLEEPDDRGRRWFR